MFQVSQLLSDAFLEAATPTVEINGFRASGILPLNPDVFNMYFVAVADNI